MSYISGGTTRGVLRLNAPATTPALSVAGEGRIYFDGTQFQASQNGAAYTPVVGGGGGGGGWTDDGTVVRLTTVGDGVGIGITSIAVGSKLEVLGDATRKNVSVLGGPALVGGDVTVLTGLGVGDGSTSGAVVLGSGTADFGTTTPGATGAVTIRSGAFTGTTNDQGDSTGSINILVGNGVSLTGQNASGGSVTISAGSTQDDNASSGSMSISAGSAAGTNSSGGSVSISAGGGYTSGNASLSAPGGGPGGGGNVSVSAGRGVSVTAGDGGSGGTILIESKGTPDTITLQRNPGTPTTSVILDDTYFTVNAVLLPSSGIGDNTSNVNIETQSGSLGGNGTSLYITPNLGIILEIGNTIKVDPDGTNNWIYGDDATVAATPGEPLTLRGGAGNTTGAGGELRLRGGAGGATGAGANAVIAGGAGGATSGAAGGVSLAGGTPVDGGGGDILLLASNGVGTNRAGGGVSLEAGDSTGSGTAGGVTVLGGTGGNSNGAGGSVSVQGGSGGATNGVGGVLNLNGGDGAGSGAGGATTIRGGQAGATGVGGLLSLIGGAGGSTSGNAGSVEVRGGVPVDGDGGYVALIGANGVGTNRDGGSVSLEPGAATGSGTAGTVRLCTATTQLLAFYSSGTGTAQQTVTGSRGGNAALASLLTALATLGLIVDNTTA